MAAERQIADYLGDPERLRALRAAYARHRAELVAEMRDHLPRRYRTAAGFVDAIEDAFYAGGALTAPDRERCIVALLAAREARHFLAIHVYVALMEGVAPEEIADVVFLSAVYTGVPALTRGIAVVERTLGLLETIAAGGDAGAMHPVTGVLPALQVAFGGT
jgi:alkylhydroperoxidase/carboxymuconolactone decarboxylase family protein YurZ